MLLSTSLTESTVLSKKSFESSGTNDLMNSNTYKKLYAEATSLNENGLSDQELELEIIAKIKKEDF